MEPIKIAALTGSFAAICGAIAAELSTGRTHLLIEMKYEPSTNVCSAEVYLPPAAPAPKEPEPAKEAAEAAEASDETSEETPPPAVN